MKKFFLLGIAIFCFQYSIAAKYALIIAIGDYPAKTGWSPISSVNDVSLIKTALLGQGFSEENIMVLINEQATRQGILTSINTLQNKLAPGDVVVIHYSGHGQQIFDDNDEEIDGLDEALVPYDAFVRYSHNYKGENHIRDDELGEIITGFRNKLGKDGQLLFMLDSCHSGSATRGGKSRGGKAAFVPDGWEPPTNNENTGSGMIERSRLQANAAPFVMISGASADELNYEYEGFGSLSYAFSKSMSELGSDFTYRQLYNKIASVMSTITPRQTPTIEGDQDYKLFKGEYVKQQPYFETEAILRPDAIKIQAGKLHGVFEETTVNILPAGTTTFSEDKVVAKGKVVMAKFNEANILLDKALQSKNTKDYWVFINERTYGDMQLKVYFDKTAEQSQLSKGISTFLQTNNLGDVVNDSLSSTVVISRNNENYLLQATNGLQEVAEATASRGVAAEEELKQSLFNYAQGSYLRQLRMDNQDYEFAFRLLPVAYDILTEEYGEVMGPEELTDENGSFKVRPEVDHVVLEVTNKSDKPLYFSIIEINSKGEISPFMPNWQCGLNDNERLLAPGKTMVFKDCIFSFAPPYEKLMLKGFASPNPINFKSTVETRGAGTRSNAAPLESFLAGTYSQTRSGQGNKVSGKVDGYSTEFLYEIVVEE